FKLRLNSSTQNVRRTSLNFDNFMLPIHYRNDEIRSSNRVKCIIMSRDASSKPVADYRQLSANFGTKTININKYMWSTAISIEIEINIKIGIKIFIIYSIPI
ncbi:hypothetical protein BLOT_013181, partial [Blomia tropicalis]